VTEFQTEGALALALANDKSANFATDSNSLSVLLFRNVIRSHLLSSFNAKLHKTHTHTYTHSKTLRWHIPVPLLEAAGPRPILSPTTIKQINTILYK